jgi:hypothetical protein
MKYFLIGYPHYVAHQEYRAAIGRMIERVNKLTGVISIFQVGNISTPGISDIDMVVVFEDDVSCKTYLMKNLSKEDNYLFTHSLYGISKSHFKKLQMHSFFHNYYHLWGQPLLFEKIRLSKEEVQFIKKQIAIEYLIRMYINMTVAKTYGIFKVRSLLLQGNALKYDLEYLNINSGNIYELIQRLLTLRKKWFTCKDVFQEFLSWINVFYHEFQFFLKQLLRNYKFYLPPKENFQVDRNIDISFSDNFEFTHRGVLFPAILAVFGKKFVNIQNRFNYFSFHIPFSSSRECKIIHERFEFLKLMKNYNHIYLNGFSPIMNALDVV